MKYSNFYKFIILAILILLLIFNINFTKWTDGDEPHYLTITQSIVNDRDLDMTNQQNEKSFLEFRNENNFIIHGTLDLIGKIRNVHSIGAGIVFVPSYILSKYVFQNNNLIIKLARLTIYLLFILGLLLTAKYLRLIVNDIDLSSFIFLIMSPTIFIFSSILFSDMIQGLCFLITTLGLFWIYKENSTSLQNNFLILTSGFFAGFNIFVHFKTLLTTFLILVGFVVYSILYHRRLIKSKQFLIFLLPIIGSIFLHMILTYSWYRTISFSSIQGFTQEQGFNKSIFNLLPNNPLIGFTGQIWDIDKGIFWMSPIVLLYCFGFKDWFIKNRFSFFTIALPSIISILIYSCYNDWGAGFAPANRFLIPFLFILFPSFYFTYINIKNLVFGKIFIGYSTIISILVLISFYKGFHRNGFPSFNSINLHYVTISRLLKIPDVNQYLKIFLFEEKPLFGIYGLFGLIFFGTMLKQFLPILKILYNESKVRLKHE
jgi:hypothetical protein